MIFKNFTILLYIFSIVACGFKSDPQYLNKRSQLRKTCDGLTVKDRYAYQGESDGSVQRSYRIEAKDNNTSYDYGIDSSFLSDQNYMSRITVSKYIKDKKCSDQYLHDVRMLNED